VETVVREWLQMQAPDL